jgi:ribosomal protein S18 acetylase RimI-like enzyme
VSIAVTRAGAERLDDLRPLFLALHEHHRHVTPQPIPLVESDDAAWKARRAAYAEHLADGTGFLHVADDDPTAIGYAFTIVRDATDDTFPLAPRYAELYTLSVAPAARGSGVGTLLLDAVDDLVAALDVSALQVAVMADNDDAIRLYRRRGLVTGEILMYRFADRS